MMSLISLAKRGRANLAGLWVDLARSFRERKQQQRHGDAAMKAVVSHDRHIGARQQLGGHEVHHHGGAHSAQLSWHAHAVQLELGQTLEDVFEHRRNVGLTIDDLDVVEIDLGGLGSDLLCHELAEHLKDVAVEAHGFFHAFVAI